MSGRRALIACLTLALCATGGLAAGAGAKKKAKKKVGPYAATVVANAPIPEGVPATPSVPVLSTITVPKKKYKGKVVGDVNVTGITTTGSAAGAAGQLGASLTAPNGRTVDLFSSSGGNSQSLGPWTLDDDTATAICSLPLATPCLDPTQTLRLPFAGTSNLTHNFNASFPPNGPLASFNGVRMNGIWTLRIYDLSNAGGVTSVLNRWGLKITPAKPVKS